MAQQHRISIFARWFLPTIGNLASISVLYVLISESRRFLVDGDTGYHIRIGDLIRQTGTIPRVDPFSFSMPGHQWFAWEWLADVIMSWIHSAFGLVGIVGASVFFLWLVFTLLYHWMRARGAGPFLSLVLTVFAAQISAVHLLARPHILSLGFLLLCSMILENYRRRRTRWIYLLPLLIAVWANLHAAFIVVFPIMAIYVAGEILPLSVREDWHSQARRSILKNYLMVGILSAAASLLTPYGWKLYQHIWRFLNDPALLSQIIEYQSPDFHSRIGKLVEIVLFLSMAAFVQAIRKGRWGDIGLLILWIHLIIQSARNIPLAAIIMFPIIAEHWSALLHDAGNVLSRRQDARIRMLLPVGDLLKGIADTDRRLKGFFAYAAAAIFLCFTVFGPWSDKLLNPHFEPHRHPERAVDFIASMQMQGNLYAPDEIGDYVIYKLYPKTKVFIDGRVDFYNTGAVWNDYIKLKILDPSWAEVLDKYKIQRMLLYENDPLGMIAVMSGDWKIVRKDKYSQVLVRKMNTER